MLSYAYWHAFVYSSYTPICHSFTMKTEKRIIIVSNRLPIKIQETEIGYTYTATEGGLATGLGSVYKQNDNLWIGWPGNIVEEPGQERVTKELLEKNIYPVFLGQEEIDYYYEGFSNETLWPLFHYFPSYTTYDPIQWDYYRKVNEKFAEAILKFATANDIIWIHDYQLCLVPQFIRSRNPELSIGYFNHIPFPSYEVFRALPWRAEILNGILGADVIGFHTYDDVRHFLSSNTRINNNITTANEISVGNRKVIVDAFPISIDFDKYDALTDHELSSDYEKKIRSLRNEMQLMISIDRLDYSKGILNRLKAFDLLLQSHPELVGKLLYVHVIVPSRDNVPKYKELKQEMDRHISDINGRYSTLGWQPILHFYRPLPLHMLSALYKCADVALVTPLRDGMNLVSKEYVASKRNCCGVLVLSEMAGAARELSDAVTINPTDIWDFSEKMFLALTMPDTEKLHRMDNMRKTVSKFNIHNWVKNFISRVDDAKNSQKEMETAFINATELGKIKGRYEKAGKRLIILDYDGTLVPFYERINDAAPEPKLLQLLENLSSCPRNKVVLSSGRGHDCLEQWFGHLPVDLIAEHGALYKEHTRDWYSLRSLDADWKTDIYNTLDVYCRRTPGTFIEEKSFSLAWHYRQAEEGLGQLRAQELIADIKHIISDLGLQIVQGNKVLEIKSISVNKGTTARRFLDPATELILAIGDDMTDEDTFKAMPEHAITIKVGQTPSAAKYYLRSVGEVLVLLNDLAKFKASHIADV